MIAQTDKIAFEIEDKHRLESHGWIQWKGTDVCMDLHCNCGKMSHIDAEFAYVVQCPYCDRLYHCNGHIQLIELRERPDHDCIVKGMKS